ncbi:MAG: pyrroline-5-carboxylate reductase [Hyphomicrobiaceae bacterium]
MSLDLPGRLLLVGAGNMGGALLKGWLAGGLPADRVAVQDPSPPPTMAAMLAAAGIACGPGVPKLAEPPAVMLLAVKPQIMDDVLAATAPLAGPSTLVVSVAAGRTIASIARHFAPGTAIVRTIPNTPASVGRGITVAVANAQVTPAARTLSQRLLEAVGEVGWVEDERLIDSATAVSGSGPAYLFLMAECLAAAGRAEGLPAELAMRLARATIAGAGEMLRVDPTEAAELRRNVTSPNGTTQAALDVLMAEDGLAPLMAKAVAAARRRAEELAN